MSTYVSILLSSFFLFKMSRTTWVLFYQQFFVLLVRQSWTIFLSSHLNKLFNQPDLTVQASKPRHKRLLKAL